MTLYVSTMDTSTTPTATTTTTVKNPEPEPEPLTRIQHTAKPLIFTNGVLKRHHPLHHPHHHLNAPPTVVAYKECLRNHAATLGAHAVDGCGEFMPSPTANPTDPTSLKCAACGCHRNFHRREPEDPLLVPSPTSAQHVIEYQPHHRHHPPPPAPPPHGGVAAGGESPNSASPPPISSSYYPSAPHMLLALSSGGLSAPPPENNQTTPGGVAGAPIGSNPNLRKRFRTKFTADQKEKMQKFAERVGWKMQKRDEELISEFCGEVGVEKGVFKVWMHNNKNTFGKPQQQQQTEVINKINGGIIGNTNSPPHHHNSPSSTLYHHNDISNHHHHHLQQQKLQKVNDVVVVVTNGSSSSS